MSHPSDLSGETYPIMVGKLRRLADDIECLAAGNPPSEPELAAAPLLRQWNVATRTSMCLQGSVYGHPSIGHGCQALTSQIFAIDPARRWARTYSRFYVLGPARIMGL